MSDRDDFPEGIKRVLAQRVNHRCSNPTCGAHTGGPQADSGRSLNVGVAAHITAASPGGPRFNPNLSENQRRSAENGIWLCQTCAKLIDNDCTRFTETMVRHWKCVAEKHALDQIGKSAPFAGWSANPPNLQKVDNASIFTVFPTRTKADLLKESVSLGLVSADTDIGKSQLLGEGESIAGGHYAVLGLPMNYGWLWTVLIFEGNQTDWTLVGKFDLEGQKGYVPEVLYYPAPLRVVALTYVQGYGTGFFERVTTWYRMGKDQPTDFLSYPVRLWVIGWGVVVARTITMNAVRIPQVLTSGAKLILQFTADYQIDTEESRKSDSDNTLFSVKKTITLEWSTPAEMFLPMSAADDFSTVSEMWQDSTSECIQHNSEAFLALARGGSRVQRSFVANYVVPLAEDRMRRALELALQEAASDEQRSNGAC